jgi:arylsulfatase A-like enzyme
MQAMLTCTDSVLGNLTNALKQLQQWDNSLFVWSSDNGGPAYWAANNHPLRGTKGTDFQGGVRVAAFASGGLLPAAVRGTTLQPNQPIHVADWSGALGVPSELVTA